ncbi:hypothetical protein [Pantanalinema sp. GBBB05]|uniref:hypothetical protein n=1 Tax=Pantanalinema sp. GBBB05 TaxID=2604139 RepID=UPI001D3EA11B|nr:hypothetical protein [Pantanalinema sp. GBBB05]
MPDVYITPNQLSITVSQPVSQVVDVAGGQGPAGTPAEGGNASYDRAFTNSDLSIAGLLPVVHDLNTNPSGVTVFNSSGEMVLPDRVEVLTANTLSIDLSSFIPLQGAWSLSITQ